MEARSSSEGVVRAAPTPRKMTLAGGFQIATADMPQKQSGRSSSGDVVPALADDPKSECSAVVLALICRLAEVGQEVQDGRYIQAEESLKVALRQLDEARRYAQRLALTQKVPFRCPRCQVAETHDAGGTCFCSACVTATYGRAKV